MSIGFIHLPMVMSTFTLARQCVSLTLKTMAQGMGLNTECTISMFEG